MKLGIFDSGLGGLVITKAVKQAMPDLDILYLGDTLHVPYGNRSEETIYLYTRRCMEYLFEQGCKLIVIACNTASASALRQLQQQWLPVHYPDRNIIGVIVPTIEEALESGYKNLGMIATSHTVSSQAFDQELQKINPDIKMNAKATPLLVPLIENDGMKWVEPVLKDYLESLLAQNIECLILGCTHYAFLKKQIEKIIAPAKILSQDDIIPHKLSEYLARHPEYNDHIGRNARIEFQVTDLNDNYAKAAREIYGQNIHIEKAVLPT